jgi:hypothetical protein
LSYFFAFATRRYAPAEVRMAATYRERLIASTISSAAKAYAT